MKFIILNEKFSIFHANFSMLNAKFSRYLMDTHHAPHDTYNRRGAPLMGVGAGMP